MIASKVKAKSQASRRGRPRTGARERILEAAHEVLVSDGYHGLTTQKVADRSGANKALIQYYFGSKDGLVEAVAAELSDGVLKVLEDALEPELSLERMVEKVVDRMWEFFHGAADLQRVYFDLVGRSIGHKSLKSILSEARRKYRALLNERIESVVGGRFSPKQRNTLICYFMATFDGLAFELVQGGDDADLSDALELFKKTAIGLLTEKSIQM